VRGASISWRHGTRSGLAFAHTGNDRFLTGYTLADIETRTGTLFLRANRSELVNIERIARISGLRDGSAMLRLGSGHRVRVSRRRAGAVRTALES